MTRQILLSVDKKNLSVAPGAKVELAVKVQNLTTLLDQVAVRAEGIDPSWVQVIPPFLPVFAQGEATARVVFQPPRDSAVAVAGNYPLRVCGASQEHPGQEGDAAAELGIQLVGDYRIWLEKGEGRGVQEGIFTLKAQNGANAAVHLQFNGDDSTQALWFKFDPFQLLVPPGGDATSTLTVRAKNAAVDRRALAFNVTAQGEFAPKDGPTVTAPAHQISGQFVQEAAARLTISIQPPQVQAVDSGSYHVYLGNPGGAPASVQMTGADDEADLEFNFRPAQVTLPPQSQATIDLIVTPKTALTSESHRYREFRVTAQPVDAQAPSVSTKSVFDQLGVVPAPPPNRNLFWIIALVALFGFTVVALICIAAFGFGIVR